MEGTMSLTLRGLMTFALAAVAATLYGVLQAASLATV